jgi:hypothetical protein
VRIEKVSMTRSVAGGGRKNTGEVEMRATPRTAILLPGVSAAGLILAGCGPTSRDFTTDYEMVYSPVNDDADT